VSPQTAHIFSNAIPLRTASICSVIEDAPTPDLSLVVVDEDAVLALEALLEPGNDELQKKYR